MKSMTSKCLALLAVFLMAASVRSAFAATCESLAASALKDATVTRAEVVAPGKFVAPDGGRRGAGGGNAFKDLPAFCRVAVTLTPSSDSDIKIEVWLTASGDGSGSGWKGKFQAVG